MSQPIFDVQEFFKACRKRGLTKEEIEELLEITSSNYSVPSEKFVEVTE